jgi:hypothetical protein
MCHSSLRLSRCVEVGDPSGVTGPGHRYLRHGAPRRLRSPEASPVGRAMLAALTPSLGTNSHFRHQWGYARAPALKVTLATRRRAGQGGAVMASRVPARQCEFKRAKLESSSAITTRQRNKRSSAEQMVIEARQPSQEGGLHRVLGDPLNDPI